MRDKNKVWFAILGLPGLGAKDTWLARTTRFVGVLAGIACPLLMLGIARADYDFSQIDAGGVNGTYLLAINTLEQYVGVTVDENHHNHGVTPGGPFDAPGATDTFVSGINDAGRFVGYYYDGPHSHGFLWDGFGFTQIDVPGESDTQANGINNANQIAGIAGRNSFLLTDDTFTEFGFAFAVSTSALAINDAGRIVGWVRFSFTETDGFVRDPDGTLSNFLVPDADATYASGINNLGQIVGYYSAGGIHGFLLDDGQFTTIDVPGAVATYARGINDFGQIVGYFYDQDGVTVHGFIATPQ